MSQSRPDTVEHLDEQPWYDYRECLHATVQNDKSIGRLIGEIFLVRIAAMNSLDGVRLDAPVHHMFWALKITEGGPEQDRYRMCLYKAPLENQRTLRGLENPGTLIRSKFRTGRVILKPTSGAKFWI